MNRGSTVGSESGAGGEGEGEGEGAVNRTSVEASNIGSEIHFNATITPPTADYSNALWAVDAASVEADNYSTAIQIAAHGPLAPCSGFTAHYSEEGMQFTALGPLPIAECFEDDYLAYLRQLVKNTTNSPGLNWPDDLDMDDRDWHTVE